MRETPSNASGGTDGDLDFRAIGAALWRRRLWVLIPTAIALILSFAVVSMMTPRYKSEARVLYEGRESVFLRPEAERQGDRSSAIDPETITSQVQLVLSREVARQVIGQLRLNEKPEFDPVLRGIGMVKQIFIIAGLAKDPLRMSPEERVFESFYERVQAYQVDKSRVIAIEFWSTDPELAANVANAIADSYIEQQQQARLDQTRAAGSFLAGEIESLRQKVADAEAKAAEFRAKSNLFVGTNNNILSTQQLGESSSQLAVARTQQAESEAKARLIREMLKSGKPIEYGDIINSELIRRLNEQRITLRAQLAEQSSTLLGNHPRIKELRAQITDLERQIREEAERLVRSFENDAKIASARMEQASAGLDKLKLAAASSNGDDVQLRALEREAKAQRDLLESYLAKYREASARENLGASIGDARVISHAIVSNTPYFPKKLPIVLMATFATMFLGVGLITTGELLASSGAQPYGPRSEAEPDAAPQKDEAPRLLAPPAPQPGAVVPETSVSAAADRLRATPDGRSRDIVLGLTADVQSAATAIVLARALAPGARVVVVDLAFANPRLAALSGDPTAPGVADLVQGRASFGAVMARDRGSRAMVVGAGRDASDIASVVKSPRLKLALDALAHANDHIIIDGGTLGEIPVESLASLARRVILAVPADAADAAREASRLLQEAGIAESAIITAPAKRAREPGSNVPEPQAA